MQRSVFNSALSVAAESRRNGTCPPCAVFRIFSWLPLRIAIVAVEQKIHQRQACRRVGVVFQLINDPAAHQDGLHGSAESLMETHEPVGRGPARDRTFKLPFFFIASYPVADLPASMLSFNCR
jgi:hypothetical protein